jgi:predicted secreted protein
MNPISAMAIYFITWWTTLFVVLPFWVQTDEQVQKGNEPGAPMIAHMKRKFLLTTVIATIVFAGLYWLLTQDHFSISDLPFFDITAKPLT